MMGQNQQNSFPDFFKVRDTFQPFVSLFCEIFYCTNVLQIACVSLRLSEGRFACLTLLLVLVTKWNIVVFYTGHLAYLLDSLVCYQTMTCKNLAMCWGELSAVIAWLTSKFLWSGWKW